MRRNLLAWTQTMLGLLLLVGSAAQASRVAAQGSPAPELSPSKHYTSQSTFSLPIRVDAAARPSMREVLLLVKTGNEQWKQADSAGMLQDTFRYTVPADGEYWFTLVTVDNQGNRNPKNAEQISEQDIVKVVVDTKPPAVELKQVKLPNGDAAVFCEINDANPDNNAVKITYRGANNVIQVLEPISPCLFRVGSPEVLNLPLQVVVADKAKNTTTRTVVLSEGANKQAPADDTTSGLKQGMFQAPTPPLPAKAVDKAVLPSAPSVEADSRTAGQAKEQSEAKPGHDAVQRQLINTTRAALDYRIDHVGPSGVGKVEVWYTGDQGASWRRLCEDADKHSPAEFDLPGDGVYGVRVVVANGNGFGGRPPVAGDQPHIWIEVDATAPIVHLKEVDPITNGGPLEIQWTASDKNLAAGAINLYFAARKEGPWQPIARGLKNDGHYKWAFPSDQGGQFFLRVEAVDLAGNVARSDSASAVVLDMTEPRASVLGVTAVPSQPAPFRGN
jgi:hypothetical protein